MGKYELKKALSGQVYFILLARNGQLVLQSEYYESKFSDLKGVSSVKLNSSEYNKFKRSESKEGKYYFELMAGNHQVIGQSQLYSSGVARNNGNETVRKFGPYAEVHDLTDMVY